MMKSTVFWSVVVLAGAAVLTWQDTGRLIDFGTRVGGKSYPSTITVLNSTNAETTVRIEVLNAPWIAITGSTVVQVPAGAFTETGVQLNLANLPNGKHQGTIRFTCLNCPAGTPAVTTETAVVMTVPGTTKFGDDPNDAKFGGLVNGQPVPACQMIGNVIAEMEQSSFGATPHGQQILANLKSKYADNSCSDITFVTTTDSVSPDGKFVKAGGRNSDGDEVRPGEALYERQASVGNVVVFEEIYVGLDLQRTSLQAARNNPGAFYICTYEGQLAVVEKADLVHNFAHEGLHAQQSGRQNVTMPGTEVRASSIEEEQEGKIVGDQAAAALGLPPSSDSIGNYGGRGRNEKYVPLTPAAHLPMKLPAQLQAAVTANTAAGAPAQRSALSGPGTGNAPGARQTQQIGFFAKVANGLSASVAATGPAVQLNTPRLGADTGSLGGGLHGQMAVEARLTGVPSEAPPPAKTLVQWMGITLVDYANTQTVITSVDRPIGYLASTSAASAWRLLAQSAPQAAAPAVPVVRVLFSSLGKSSGPAFTMTVVHDGTQPLQLSGTGFVLYPLERADAARAERELAKLGGRKSTSTVAAYCLEMPKTPPMPGMIYQLAPAAMQNRFPTLAPIMAASRALKDAGRLRPDGDPVDYFHALRQWAVWTVEQKFQDEAAFTRAFLDHAKKNLASAGRRWTRELEDAVRGILPNRWRDIQQVLAAAR